MFSDSVPALVYPDTPEARTDARIHDPNDEVEKGYCPFFVEDRFDMPSESHYRIRCANRRPEGDRTHSWCHRCMVGFIMLTPEESDLYARMGTRMEATRL